MPPSKTAWLPEQSSATAGAARLAKGRAVALAFLLGALTFVTYGPVGKAGFIWDDDANVIDNPTLRSLDGLRQIWFVPGSIQQYYPLMYTSYWLEYQLWGLNPLGYHIVNVVLHTTAAILLWRLLERLHVPGAWLASAVFAVHPVNVESVAWITERKNVLSLVLAIAAILSYLRFSPPDRDSKTESKSAAKHWAWYGLALALFALALFAKTVVVTLPAVLLVIYWWKRERISAADVVPLVPFFALSVAFGLVTARIETYQLGARGADWSLTLLGRTLLAGRAIWFYLAKLALPHPLVFFYPRFSIDTRSWWQYLFPAAVVTVLIALWLLRRRIGRGPLAAALIYCGVLMPALGFFNIYYMRYAQVSDHFQYHATIAAIALATAAAASAVARWTKPWTYIAGASALAVVGALAVVAWHRAGVYVDTEVLFRDTLARNPYCDAAYGNLALYLDSGQRYDEAVTVSREALTYFPNDAGMHSNLAAYLLRQGTRDGFRPGQVDEILDHCHTALRLAPDDIDSLMNLGFALTAAQRPEEALVPFARALQLQPGNIQGLYGMAAALVALNRFSEAHQCYDMALRLAPDEARIHFALGQLLVMEKRFPAAIPHFEAVLRTEPEIAEAHYELAGALVECDDFRGAAEHYRTAVALRPEFARAWNALGMLRIKQGQSEEAIELFREALRRAPDDVDARANLEQALRER